MLSGPADSRRGVPHAVFPVAAYGMLTDDQAKLYLWEVAHESEVVDTAFRRFKQAADEWIIAETGARSDGTGLGRVAELERTIQLNLEAVLAAFARVSLFLFPEKSAKPRTRDRGEALRTRLGITEAHPLARRDLRNHWMHLDERLDAYLEQHGVVTLGYALGSAAETAASQLERVVRFVDPGARRVYVLGQEYALESLADAVEHVGTLAALYIADGAVPSGLSGQD